MCEYNIVILPHWLISIPIPTPERVTTDANSWNLNRTRGSVNTSVQHHTIQNTLKTQSGIDPLVIN